IYKRLFDKQGSVASIEELQQRFFESKPFFASAGDFKRIPGNPIAYWASDGVKKAFNDSVTIGEVSFAKFGMSTGNSAYIRAWQEVPINKIGFQFDSPSNFNMHQYWAPYDKGGPFRKWFGNQTDVVFWKENGKDIRNSENSAVRNSQFFCRPHVSWTLISSSLFAVRFFEKGFLLDTASNALYEHDREFDLFLLIAFLNTKVVFNLLSILNPSINFSCGVIGLLPIKRFDSDLRKRARGFAEECISLAETDWNSFETSWNFRDHPLVRNDCRAESLDASWNLWLSDCKSRFERMWDLETENNRLFIEAYGLQGELSPEVPQDQITLTQPDRGEDIKRLISYGVGCTMGRYTLDKPGLIYAHSGNKGFDSNQYKTFPADPDGIIPFMEGDWFHDDASNRLIEFIGVAWPKEYLEENLKFIVESLDPNRNGEPRKTIRRYLANGFFKDHLKTYKRRPIYWLFSSGNQRAFQCLVYLHRYNESTLSRMRTEYVIPLQGKSASRIEQLADEIQNATSTSHRKKMEKERDTLIKQQAELQSFDEKLRHYADLRISLDLDDGVKVNYGKFGDLLAEVKTVTGGNDGD
ncbi:MAG: BREX-1 system adenine-specific DNA-methyltransferase PglX, partial [Pseudomonadota bacterium]